MGRCGGRILVHLVYKSVASQIVDGLSEDRRI